MDTTGNHCADYAEFLAFCKLQVDALLGLDLPEATLGVLLIALPNTDSERKKWKA